MRKLFLLLIIICPVEYSQSQTTVLDSIFNSLQKEKKAHDTVKLKLYREISYEYRKIDLDSSIHYLNKAKKLSRRTALKYEVSVKLDLISTYTEIGNTHKAIQIGLNLIEQIETNPENVSPYQAANVHAMLSRCYSYAKQGEIGLEHLQKAIDICEKSGEEEYWITLNNNLSHKLLKENKPEEAMKVIEKSLDKIDELIDLNESDKIRYLAYIKIHQGWAFICLKEYENAFRELSVSRSLVEKSAHHEFQLLLWRIWTRYYIETNNLSVAEEYADSIHMDAVLRKNTVYQITGLKTKAQLATLSGDAQRTSEIYKKLVVLKDSISKENLETTRNSLRENIKLEREKNEFREKSLNAELKAERAKKNRTLLISVLVILIAFVVIGLQFFRNRLRRLKTHKKEVELTLEAKNAKLSSNLLQISKLNELINSIKEELTSKGRKEEKNDDLVVPILQKIKLNSSEGIFSEFEIQFEQIHSTFYRKLLELHPDLTINERRLCAFIKLNMRSKEISSITGQTPHSINVARTRLRKKLNLTNSSTSLVEYIQGI